MTLTNIHKVPSFDNECLNALKQSSMIKPDTEEYFECMVESISKIDGLLQNESDGLIFKYHDAVFYRGIFKVYI